MDFAGIKEFTPDSAGKVLDRYIRGQFIERLSMKTIFAILFLLCLAIVDVAAADGTDLGLSAEISSATMPFEGRDTLVLSLSWQGEPFKYVLADLPIPSLENLQVLGSSSTVASSVDSTTGQEVTTRKYSYVLGATDFGTGVIDPMDVTVKNRLTGEDHKLSTGRLTIEIAKPVPLEDKGGISGVMYFAIPLVIFLIGALIFFLVQARRKAAAPVKEEAGQYPEQLEEIRRETIADAKLFYARIYRLLVKYVEQRHGLTLSGSTGEQVIAQISELDSEPDRERIAGWLKLALEKKFNPTAAHDTQAEDTYRQVKIFFEQKQPSQ